MHLLLLNQEAKAQAQKKLDDYQQVILPERAKMSVEDRLSFFQRNLALRWDTRELELRKAHQVQCEHVMSVSREEHKKVLRCIFKNRNVVDF